MTFGNVIYKEYKENFRLVKDSSQKIGVLRRKLIKLRKSY